MILLNIFSSSFSEYRQEKNMRKNYKINVLNVCNMDKLNFE